MEQQGLQAIADRLWVATRRLRFAGLETGTRMTVVGLADGGLFVHSPVGLDAPTRQAVDALGPVKAVVSPSRFHHLYVGEWSQAYPAAVVCACPGLEHKRSDVRWHRVLGDRPEAEWRGEIEQVFFGARSLESEVVFFHRASRTLICADAIFNLAHHPSRLTRVVARLVGNGKPGATWLERALIRDRAAAREQVDRMLAWNADRIVLAHGDIIERGGHEILRRAYAWL
ncbi:MAG: DUF4336 domain-containing protein [Deltaproteobacteria bacterium]|nr:MAG: DUF4336 domain-containing protein [Deltaproteobacteria bacterium]